jgi:hypothetical protein
METGREDRRQSQRVVVSQVLLVVGARMGS